MRVPGRMIIPRSPLIVLVLLLTSAAACGIVPTNDADSTAETRIVTSLYPLAWLAREVGGTHVSVTNLTRSGGDPHHVTLSPRQIIEISEADLVVYIDGAGAAVGEAVEQHAQDPFDVTTEVELLSADHSGDTTDGQSNRKRHEHAAIDPHVWLDPLRFATIARELGDRLASTDPAHAEAYHRRAENVVETLQKLDHAYRTGLRDCASNTLVVSHKAFGYLAERYGLRQVGITGQNPHAAPSPARVADVVRLARAREIRTVFYDESIGPDLARVVANEIGASTTALDPIARPPTNTERADGDAGYVDAMRQNLRALRKGLGCR